MNIADMMDPDELAADIAGGFIKVTRSDGLVQYNYTNDAQFKHHWTDATKQCRGLITTEDGTVVARPFAKFMNYGQERLTKVVDNPCIVTDKLDGSLGVLYPARNTPQWRIATRGSFYSDQALWATDLWQRRYLDVEPPLGTTALFEIIYKANRIVVNYGDLEDLVLLAIIDNETGADLDLRDPMNTDWWPGQVAKIYWDITSLDEAYHLACSEEFNDVEGLVLCWPQYKAPSFRLKVKNPEYIRLHRIITGVSAKRLWEYLKEDRPLDEILERVPDEFYDWVQRTSEEICAKRTAMISDAKSFYIDLMYDLMSESCDGCGGKPHSLAAGDHTALSGISRKKLAARVKQAGKDGPNEFLVFLVADGDDTRLTEQSWKMVKPEFERPFRVDDGE